MKKIADIMNKNLATVDADDSFEEALKLRAEERKRKMKDFNYKFNK